MVIYNGYRTSGLKGHDEQTSQGDYVHETDFGGMDANIGWRMSGESLAVGSDPG